MPPPPRGGFPISNVDWKPGRLSGARIQRSAVRGLPFQQVAQIQTAFSFASLSTPADTDKEKAKKTLEGAVTDKIRDLRARTERKNDSGADASCQRSWCGVTPLSGITVSHADLLSLDQ